MTRLADRAAVNTAKNEAARERKARRPLKQEWAEFVAARRLRKEGTKGTSAPTAVTAKMKACGTAAAPRSYVVPAAADRKNELISISVRRCVSRAR